MSCLEMGGGTEGPFSPEEDREGGRDMDQVGVGIIFSDQLLLCVEGERKGWAIFS